MSETERAVVDLQGVHFSYNRLAESGSRTTDTWVLEDIDLQLSPGTWLAVAGANGSGKSTLARLIAGLYRPDRGKVQVCGVSTNASEFHPAQIGVGYLAQHPEEHVVGLTVWDDVSFGPLNLGLHADEIERRVKAALAEVGLSQLPTDKSTLHLSGGELQRVALAGVFALRPSVLILDEPTVACHPALRRTMREAVRRYVKRHNVAVLWVTHDPEEIAAADTVLVLNDGKIVFEGSPGELTKEQERGRFWGLAPLKGQTNLPNHPGTTHQVEMLDRRSSEIALKMEGVSFSYPSSERRVLNGIDLYVHQGEVVTLVGPSGAGKTTLIHLAAMLESRHEGNLMVLGEHIPSVANRQAQRERRAIVERIRPRVAVAFQQPEQQLFGVTVRDDFEFGLRHLGVEPKAWRDRIGTAIASVGLSQDFLERSPFALSGGERRRIAIALCLAQQPDLFLLDEPTAGLDYPATIALLKAIEELHAKHQISVLVATHDPIVFSRWRQRVLRLEARGIVEVSNRDADLWAEAKAYDTMIGRTYNLTTELIDGSHPETPIPVAKQNRVNAAWLKNVDPRVRFIGAAAVAASIAAVHTGTGLAVAACMVALWFCLAAYPLRFVVATLRGLWPFLLAAIVFAGLQLGDGHLTFSIEGAGEGSIVALRILLLVLSVSWLSHVGGVGEMLWAMSTLFAPLRRIGLPVTTLVGAAVIGIRMMPLLGEEASRIRRSQIVRGVNRIKGLRGHWMRVASLVIPLSASLFRRAERLGEALHLRGFQYDSQLAVGGVARGGYRNLLFLLLALAGAIAILISN